MSWLEIRACLPPEMVDRSPVIEAFRDSGIENTEETRDEVIGCLPDVDGAASASLKLAHDLRHAGAIRVDIEPLVEDDWENAWRRFFKPRRVGRRFIVRPTWEEASPEDGDLEIVLDPGQAFGTGDHPTTRLSLELLEDVDLAGKSVLDVGCGSGILAIGAKLLGASSVVASDIDPIAVEVAIENANRNRVDIGFSVADGMWGDEAVDVLVSNIISAAIIRMARDAIYVVKRGGTWIVSGVIVQNWPDVREAVIREGFMLEKYREEDGWIAARFVRG